MGREIEMKIPLTKDEFLFIYDVIYGKVIIDNLSCSNVEVLFKQDQYFSKYDTKKDRIYHKEPQVIRLRTEEILNIDNQISFSADEMNTVSDKFKTYRNCINKKTAFFTIKRKSKENGIELNREDETEIADSSVLVDFFNIAEYKRWFNKEKCAWSCHCNSGILENIDFHLELESVNNLLYIEVEVTDLKYDADLIKGKLEDFIKLIKLNPENKDSRSWVEILNN